MSLHVTFTQNHELWPITINLENVNRSMYLCNACNCVYCQTNLGLLEQTLNNSVLDENSAFSYG